MRLVVDLEKCQGHGKCYLAAPELFEPDNDDEWGRTHVLMPEIDPTDARIVALAQTAVSGCPESAISLED